MSHDAVHVVFNPHQTLGNGVPDSQGSLSDVPMMLGGMMAHVRKGLIAKQRRQEAAKLRRPDEVVRMAMRRAGFADLGVSWEVVKETHRA